MDVVIFDLDGTLVDTAPDIIDALNRTLTDIGLAPVDDRTGRSLIGGGARNLVTGGLSSVAGSQATGKMLDDAYSRFIRYYSEKFAEGSALYPGVHEALSTLLDNDLAMGVCTNKPHKLSLKVLDAFDLQKYFKAVVGGDALPQQKPAARHILETARQTAPEYSNAIMVGDSPTDVAAARNANIPVVVVDYGYITASAGELGADAVISDIRELPTLITNFWKGT